MDLAALSKAIYDRAVSDSGANKLVGSGGLTTGFYNTIVPDTAVFPFCYFTIPVSQPNDTFTGQVDEILFRISVNTQRTSNAATPIDPVERASLIIARLNGPGGASPSYGFDRYAITIVSTDGWSSGTIRRGGQNANHDNDHFQYDLDFWLLLNR